MKKFLNNIPRWLVFQTDLIICGISIILAYLVRYNFNVPNNKWQVIGIALLFVLIVKFFAILFTKSYAGIIKYTSIEDAKRVFYASGISFLVILAVDMVVTRVMGIYFIPFGVLLIDFFISLLAMAAFRVLSKILYYENRQSTSEQVNLLIYGAGEAGAITKKTLLQDDSFNYNLVGFMDDDQAKKRSFLDGVKIFQGSELEAAIRKLDVKFLIICVQNIPFQRKKDIVETCLRLGVNVRTIPPVQKWINGELSMMQIKDVAIEDILERPTIEIEDPKIRSLLYKKVILVTGAAGSIGSELVRQLAQFKPKLILLYDQAETGLYEIQNELNDLPYSVNYEVIVGDVTNIERVKSVFQEFKPSIVYHAAAYKHVPLMEDNAAEAISVNVNGTKILADMALKFQVRKFVMISTDKAVNPTNVMGASKRVAEIYCQSLNNISDKGTSFIITRFGNVLGSNGSVIPRFKKQIAEGGPLTVTHPDITRYFMTIPEASQLVLEASVMGKGGEIYVFDMGEPIKILNLAKKMIALSGLKVGRDIQILHTGLRPGEKLYEELLADPSNVNQTHHPKIMIGKPENHDYNTVKNDIDELIVLIYTQNNPEIVTKLKGLIPEFISKNSQFEKLDRIN